jgi:hypothetical protein
MKKKIIAFWYSKIKLILTILSFIAGFISAYTRSIIWGTNLYRDVQELKQFKCKTEVVLEAIQENIIRLCEKQGIQPVRPNIYGNSIYNST